MTPAILKANSLYADLEGLFERAKSAANYRLNALPEEEVAAELVEELAPVLVRLEDLIERLCSRSQASAIRRAQEVVSVVLEGV